MSYDVDIGSKTFSVTRNHTALINDMLAPERDGASVRRIEGLSGAQALPLLATAMERLNHEVTHRESSLKAQYETPGVWGSVLHCTALLGAMIAACMEFPDSTVVVEG
jgi:hypothetical protein